MEKLINPVTAYKILLEEFARVDEDIEPFLDEYPEYPGGTLIQYDDVKEIVSECKDYFLSEFKLLFGEIPEIPEEPEIPEDLPGPDQFTLRIEYAGQNMSWNGVLYQKFVFPKVGPAYTDQPFTLVYSTGNSLYVKDPEEMAMKPDNTKYQPGGSYSNNNPDIPTMEVYAPLGQRVLWVDMVHKGLSKPYVPPTEDENTSTTEGDWIRKEWGGDPNDSSHDREFWTKIHGSSFDKWSRKWNLDRTLDDSPKVIDFRFSDGQSLTVPDSTTMAMNPNGPKYREEEDGESDPKKQAPKIGAIPESTPTWVEYRVR